MYTQHSPLKEQTKKVLNAEAGNLQWNIITVERLCYCSSLATSQMYLLLSRKKNPLLNVKKHFFLCFSIHFLNVLLSFTSNFDILLLHIIGNGNHLSSCKLPRFCFPFFSSLDTQHFVCLISAGAENCMNIMRSLLHSLHFSQNKIVETVVRRLFFFSRTIGHQRIMSRKKTWRIQCSDMITPLLFLHS